MKKEPQLAMATVKEVGQGSGTGAVAVGAAVAEMGCVKQTVPETTLLTTAGCCPSSQPPWLTPQAP